MLVESITLPRLMRALRPLRPWLHGATASDLLARHRTVDYLYIRPDVRVGEVVRVALGAHTYLARVTGLEPVEPARVSVERARADGYLDPGELFWSVARQSWPVVRSEEAVWCVRWRYVTHRDLHRWWPPARVATVRTTCGTAHVALRAVLDPEEGWTGRATQLHDLGCGLIPGAQLVDHIPHDHYLGCLERVLERVDALARRRPDWLVANDAAFLGPPPLPGSPRPTHRVLEAHAPSRRPATPDAAWWQASA